MEIVLKQIPSLLGSNKVVWDSMTGHFIVYTYFIRGQVHKEMGHFFRSSHPASLLSGQKVLQCLDMQEHLVYQK